MSRVTHYACFGCILLGLVWSLWALVQSHKASKWQTRIAYFKEGAEDATWPLFLGSSNPNSALAACYKANYQWQSSYYLYAAQNYERLGKQSMVEKALQRAHDAALKRVQCQPVDAKAWLDLALILLECEGYSGAVERALVQSALLSPNEAWIAEWRIPYWVQFAPVAYQEDVWAVFEKDVDTIERSYEWRKKRLYQKLGVANKQELLKR